MVKRPLTNEEYLRQARICRENMYNWFRTRTFIIYPLQLPTVLPLPAITLDHLQDLCNKNVAIYWTKPGLATPRFVYEAIYEQWSENAIHKTDIEFGRFLAKLVKFPCPHGVSPETIQELIKIHAALCDRWIAKQERFTVEDLEIEEVGVLTINTAQQAFYKIKPLFQALILLIEDPIYNYTEATKRDFHLKETGVTMSLSGPPRCDLTNQQVRMVLTGVTDGLSAPITFQSLNSITCNSITTTLPVAIRFVMELEQRERLAYPDDRDLSVLDEMLGSDPNERSAYWGYSGPKIKGPSTDWVKE